MTYSKAGGHKFILDHTEVDDDYRGKNLGLKLVNSAVEYAQNSPLPEPEEALQDLFASA